MPSHLRAFTPGRSQEWQPHAGSTKTSRARSTCRSRLTLGFTTSYYYSLKNLRFHQGNHIKFRFQPTRLASWGKYIYPILWGCLEAQNQYTCTLRSLPYLEERNRWPLPRSLLIQQP